MRRVTAITTVLVFFLIAGYTAVWSVGRAAEMESKNISSIQPAKVNLKKLRYPATSYKPKVKIPTGEGVTKEAQECISCHSKKTPVIVQEWSKSSMAHAGVSCIDCHVVKKDNPMANQNCPGVKGTSIYVSAMVSPKTCGKCHPREVKQFDESGHARAAFQLAVLKGDQVLLANEDMHNPKLKGVVLEMGCQQCHGSIIKMGPDHNPTATTWPSHGIGNVYPDGGVGNCAACHFAHRFSIAQARKPSACSTCHLGPDHPDIEIYKNSVHGAIFEAEGSKWHWGSAPGTWLPGVDYSAPTCATCHMSGINGLQPTHNVDLRLKWNLWAPISKLRTGGYETAATIFQKTGKITRGNPLAGNPKGPQAARKEMLQVCTACHTYSFAHNYLSTADKFIELYNKYAIAATKMIETLKKKHLLRKDPWNDAAFRTYFLLWHHEGRRMRQGAVMGGQDFAHWHGVFELQQNFKILKDIYERRIKTGKIEPYQPYGVGMGE